MDVTLASHTHHTPQVGLPHKEPVTIDTIANIAPKGAKLLATKDINFILKIIFKIEANTMKAKIESEIREDGT